MKEEKKLNDEELITTFYRCCGGSANSCANCYYRIGTSRCNMKKLNRDILDLIRRLQYGYSSASKASEEWKVKYEQEREENVAQQAEIERLTEEKQSLIGRKAGLDYSYNQVKEKNAELQKQVEYWESETKIARRDIDEAVKDTAKDVLQRIMNIIKKSDCFLSEEVIKIMAKQKGVEVE